MRLFRFTAAALFAAFLTALSAPSAFARGDNMPGDFDFYVLSLSWSPTYCEDRGHRDRIQCGERPYAFVVHGLWPQYERGWPEDCPTFEPRDVPRHLVDRMLDIMPSPTLVRHEWRKHGTCSGLDQRSYFQKLRDARSVVTIPPAFVDVQNYLMTSPALVERAFIEANPGLSTRAMSVTCDTRRLQEVRICLTRDLKFRDCPQVDRAACRMDRVVMPPVR